MDTIKILGKEYKKPTLDFQAICELEELGFDFAKVDKKLFNSVKCLLAYVMKISVEEVCDLINQHPEEYQNLATEMFKLIEGSDFLSKMIAKK